MFFFSAIAYTVCNFCFFSLDLLFYSAEMPSLKLISATDTQYSAEILKSLNEQRNHGLFCDITIIIQDKKFRAHKTILSASSTYFYQLFTVAGQVVELNFIRPEIFEQILNYIYSSRIVRVRSDMVEELISAGQILGVKFIANLALPLSQVKGISGLSKGPEQKNDTSSENMPVITESFSISAEEFNQPSKPAENEDDSDDVVFVSQTEAQIKTVNQKKVSSEVIDLDEVEPERVGSEQNTELNNGVGGPAKRAATPQKMSSAKLSGQPVNSPLRSPDSSSNVSSPPASVSTESVPSAQARSNSLASGPLNDPHSSENRDILGVQKKQVTTSSQQGHSKIRLSDVSEASAPKPNADGPHPAAQTTMNTPTDMDSFSPGCKVYTNIGENTYDIVSLKEDPGEGGSKPSKGKRAFMATPLKASDNPPLSAELKQNRKRNKTELEDHYELVMDGKTFFVCIICKRPYVCMTSLRRHFNTHSWEKKYPCRFCDKVFALAEYRTKHEAHHTGERRYQCLLCNDTFITYQLLSSHCKSVHSQDPSGRKEKDDGENNLYRLLPGKTGQKRVNTWETEPLVPQDGGGDAQHTNTGGEAVLSSAQRLEWDSMFAEPSTHMQTDTEAQPGSMVTSAPSGPSEFEYITPETY